MKMDSSDSDSDSEQNRQLMFLAVSVKRKKGNETSEEDRCSEVQGYLNTGVGINATEKKAGDTVLHVAVKKGFGKVVTFLLEKCACTTIKNNQGDTAKSLAEKLGKQEIARIIKDYEGYPSKPIASTSKVQMVDNPGDNYGSVVSGSNRKRTANIGLADSVKKPKLGAANLTQSALLSGPGSTSFRKDRRRSKNDEETSQIPRWDTKETYAASGAKHALHGVIYQLKHLMLTLNRAWKMGYRFRLATEMDSAEKFDDLVFEYEDSGGRRVLRLVQMKHKQDDTKLIKVSDLLAEDAGEFSVKKYFTSWRKVKKHAEFAESESKCFILCTNIGLDIQGLKDEQIGVIRVEESDDFLKVTNTMEQPPRFKLRPAKDSKLYAVLESASDLHQLAKALAKCVRDSDALTLKTDIFKRYHMALAEEVLDKKNRRKFADTFIRNSGLSPIAGKFREIFFTYVEQFPSNKKSSEPQIWNDLGKKLLATSESFGKSTTGVQQTQFNVLPDDHITDKEIEDFFDEFVLAVNQPNEEELGEMIKREFGEYSQFNLLNTNFVGDSFQNVLLNWFKDKKGVYLVRDDAKKFFDEMERELSSLITVGLNLPYPAKLKKYDVQFKCEITGLRNFLVFSNSTENLIWQLISSEDTLLTALRIYQTLNRIQEYKKHDSYIFIELKNLLLPEIKSQVFRAFESSRSHRLLIIECGLDSSRQDIDHLRKNLCEVITKLHEEKITGKRIILLLLEKDARVMQLGHVNKISYEGKCDISIDNIARATQQKLLGKKVIQFQGRKLKTSFEQLLAIANFDDMIEEKLEDYRRIISPKTLVELIRNRELQIGSESRGLGEIEEYYIRRSVERRVVIKDGLLGDSEITDVLAFSGIVEETLRKIFTNSNGIDKCSSPSDHGHLTTHIILENGQETEHFDNLCQKNPDLNIHWLQRESEKFVWIRSFGNISNLMKYREETRSDHNDEEHRLVLLSEEQLADYDERRKIVIISDTAGMGKSTVLTRLAEKIRATELSVLVVRIDLTDHTTALALEKKERSFKSDDINSAVDFLVDKLHPKLEREAVSLFKTIIKVQRNAALLFDGFDEISPDYEETVIDLLQALAKLGVKQLFVATRPHTSRGLEEKLGVFSHTLEPFSTANQMEFLTKFWTRGSIAPDSGSFSFGNKEPLREHARNVMNLLAKSIDSSMREFTGVPLQIRMVAEVFPFDESELPKTITIIEMYSKFVDKKYDIYCTEKKRADLTIPAVKSSSICERNGFSIKHQRFALNLLFDKTIVDKLLSTQGDDFNDTWEDMINDQERTGIVTTDSDGQVRFIHRTFAEYFAAIFLFKMLLRDRCNQSVREFCVGELFVKREYQVIRAFLNCLLVDKNAPLETKSWKLDLSKHSNPEGETAYHVVARERQVEITKFLLNSLCELCEGQVFNVNLPSEDGKSPLIVAVEAVDNLDVVKCLIDGGADVNLADSWHKKTALHVTVDTATVNVDILNFLIERGADINSQTKEGKTSLHYALMSGNPELVKYLHKKGADIHHQLNEGETVLHLAALTGNLDLVKYLAEKGANIHSQTEDDETPLHYAANSGDPDLVKYLTEKYLAEEGLDINSQNTNGEAVLHFAARYGNLEVVKYLTEKGADINHQNRNSETVLHLAARSGNTDLGMFLTEKGANIHSQTHDGETPLHYAAASGNSELVKYLTEKGANIDTQTKDGETILHYAARSDNSELLKYFMEKGAHVDSRTKDGKTPLHLAVQCGQSKVAMYLVEEGADINSRTEDGQTPLHYAASFDSPDLGKYLAEEESDIKDGKKLQEYGFTFGIPDLVKYLAQKGADINSENANGDTPMHCAATSGNLDQVKCLVEEGANVNTQNANGETVLHLAAHYGNPDLVEYLTTNGADINSRTKELETPLHYATISDNLDLVRCLAEKGADIHSATKDGETPLLYAATSRNPDLVKYLADKGADIHSRNNDGETPLHYATTYCNLDLVKFLVERGADVDSQNTNNETALHLAARSGNSDLMEYLSSI